MSRRLATIGALLGLSLVLEGTAVSDPCGMVPPIYTGPGKPIERIGAQRTYVFYKDGAESIALRPGFRGKVDQFGMLIPFPTPPELRKLPDEVFPHLAAAIDPPIPSIYVGPNIPRMSKSTGAVNSAPGKGGAGLGYSQVKVLRQEAVGMYEVAVLAAGSSQALKRWMDQHGYRYPDGMGKPVDDYVKAGWCFVAVKTKVGQKKGVNPRPGLRKVNSKLPTGSSFDGHVQAMGFRFRTKKLVVPMRLSAFNEGRLRNIVYVLADRPMRINDIASKYVVRQLPGPKVFRNLTKPLPFRLTGGTIKDARKWHKQQIKRRREPKQYNRFAAELFAADLWAVDSGKLSLPYEESKKELLRIGERLNLRGNSIDKLNQATLARKVDRAVRKALGRIKQMTLSVIDGDFPRKVIAAKNLTFSRYRMDKKRNNASGYNARLMKPGPKKTWGILYEGPLKNPRVITVKD
jgi:hypothetical protein